MRFRDRFELFKLTDRNCQIKKKLRFRFSCLLSKIGAKQVIPPTTSPARRGGRRNLLLKARQNLLNKDKQPRPVPLPQLTSLHSRGKRLHPFILFFIRAVLGVAIAFLITRMFRGSVSMTDVAGLAILLVGLAYVFEYFRKRKSR